MSTTKKLPRKFCPKCHYNSAIYQVDGVHVCPKHLLSQAALDSFVPITVEPEPVLGLPDDDAARKALPIFDGVLMYFPDACAAVAEVSRIGNEQHNPGEPLHWARGKSMDQYNTALRHLMDHRRGKRYNGKARHLANAAWRVLAALQLDIEEEARDARRESESRDRQAAEAAPCVLLEAGTERYGRGSRRLSRRASGVRVRNRGKGAR